MLNKVLKTVQKHNMFGISKDVTVALSGGADSVCLLLVLCKLKEILDLTLSAIHINHSLRGAESDRDELFAKELCDKLGVPFFSFKVDAAAEAEKRGVGVELAARELRYEIFKREAKGVVATAHSADDNLETVLFNMTRGSGLRGISGIPPLRDIYIRPLINCSREEIEAFLAEEKIPFVTDSTNLTDEYTRNRIRHRVVPELRSINNSAVAKTSAMCESLREDDDFLQMTARRIYTISLREKGLDAELLKINHPAIIKRVVALYLAEEYSITPEAHELEASVEILKAGGKTNLSGNMAAVCRNGFFFVTNQRESGDTAVSFKTEILPLTLPFDTKINNLLLKNAIDCDKIVGDISLRTRKEGDKIRLRGRNCTKSLKKLFCELRLEKALRDKIPVACDDEGVVWIYSVGVADRVKVDQHTKNAVWLKSDKLDKI